MAEQPAMACVHQFLAKVRQCLEATGLNAAACTTNAELLP